MIALVGMATAFVEATLAQLFKTRDARGQFRGGPAYYMERGLGARWMGVLFSIFLIIAFGFVFNSVQANTISGALIGAFGLDWGTLSIAGSPVQVRNPDATGVQATAGAFMASALPVAGFAIIEAADLSEAVDLVSRVPCAVAHGVVEIWPLEEPGSS